MWAASRAIETVPSRTSNPQTAQRYSWAVILHPVVEGRVAPAAVAGGLEREADSVQDVLVQRFREVSLEDAGGDGRHQARVVGAGGLDIARELRPDVVQPQGGDSGDVVARLEGQPGWRMDGPDAVALEPPERLLGMVRLPRRPELT
jgi:hypothetical protein